jgi:hypothetical protein
VNHGNADLVRQRTRERPALLDGHEYRGVQVWHSETFSSTRPFDLKVRHRVVLFGIAAAILIAGVALVLALPALAELLPHDPSSCGGG